MSLLSDYLALQGKNVNLDLSPNNLLIESMTTKAVREMSNAIATECLLRDVSEVKISVFAEIDGWSQLVDEKIIHLAPTGGRK